MDKAIRIVMVVCFFAQAGCIGNRPSVADLDRATELVLRPGTQFEKRYTGPNLDAYLATFEPCSTKPRAMYIGTDPGYIVIDGVEYPLEVSEVKLAGRPAVLSIGPGWPRLHIRQPWPGAG